MLAKHWTTLHVKPAVGRYSLPVLLHVMHLEDHVLFGTQLPWQVLCDGVSALKTEHPLVYATMHALTCASEYAACHFCAQWQCSWSLSSSSVIEGTHANSCMWTLHVQHLGNFEHSTYMATLLCHLLHILWLVCASFANMHEGLMA